MTGLEAVQAKVPFPLTAPATLVGLPRQEVRLVDLRRHDRRARDLRQGPRRHRRPADAAQASRRRRRAARRPRGSACRDLDQRRLGEELDTALGTVVSFERGGVRYTVAGSVPPAAAEAAARGALTVADAPPIEVRGLVKRYGDLVAVDGVDLTVSAGDVFGYLGPNGAGKTTSLRMMLGLIRPTAGTVRLFGRDPQAGVAALEGVAGFVEAPRFYPYLTAARTSSCSPPSTAAARAGASTRCSTSSSCATAPSDRVGGYSHGMRQRLGIAAALLRRPQLLLLDEPATGLDPAGMRDMRAADPPPGRRRDDRPALEPPAGRGRGALQPRRDRASRAHGLRGRAGRPAPRRGHRATGCAPPTTSARWPCARRSPGSRTPRRRRTAASPSVPRASAPSASCRSRSPRRARSSSSSRPTRATLEDLFFALTEGDGEAAADAAPVVIERAA